MESLIVYSDLLFSLRPLHDKAVGSAEKTEQEYHRSNAYCQDDGWVTHATNHSWICESVQCFMFSIYKDNLFKMSSLT